MPPVANASYACAQSSTDTPCLKAPSVIAGLVETGVRTPMRSISCEIRFVPDLEPRGRVDGVVGDGQRRAERAQAAVGVLEVVDLELLAAAVRDVEDALARLPDRADADPAPQRRGEDERLDGRARLALALRGEVERPVGGSRVPPTSARTSPVALSITTIAAAGPAPPRLRWIARLRRLLQVEVERRLDAQAALVGAPRAEALDELLADPGREVGRLRRRRSAATTFAGQRLGASRR